jgi:hypothetical protein
LGDLTIAGVGSGSGSDTPDRPARRLIENGDIRGPVAPAHPSCGRVTPPAGGSGGSTIVVGWRLGAALLVLVVVAAAVTGLAGLGIARATVIAAVHAVLQLGVVSVIIVAVVHSLWLSLGFVLVMLAVAAVTSARRMTPDRSGLRRPFRWCSVPLR